MNSLPPPESTHAVMDVLPPPDSTAVATESLIALSALIKSEDGETSMPSRRTFMLPHINLGPTNSAEVLINTPESSENSKCLKLQGLELPNIDSDVSSEELLRSFKDPTTSNLAPTLPTLGSLAAPRTSFVMASSVCSMAYPIDTQSVKIESNSDNIPSPSLSTSTMSTVSDIAKTQEGLAKTADNDCESSGSTVESTPSLLHGDGAASAASSSSQAPSSEEAQVQLLQIQVHEAATKVQTLQEKANQLGAKKDRYEKEYRKLGIDIEATGTDVKELQTQKKNIEAQKKALQAQKNTIEAAIRQKKAQISNIEDTQTSVRMTITAKFKEHVLANCEVDKAAKQHRILEAQLENAKYEARLIRECPDAALRQLVLNTMDNAKCDQLIGNGITGEATLIDLSGIETLLEQAEESTKNSSKSQVVKYEYEDQVKPEVKKEYVRVKTEHGSTPAPLSATQDSNPTAHGLLDTVRQIRELSKTLQTQLQNVKSLKRKNEDGKTENDSIFGERRVKPEYPLAGTESDSDESMDGVVESD